MAKKHYRAFKKQLEVTSPKGVFIPYSQKFNISILGFTFIALTFIIGTLVGYVLGKKN